MQIRSDQIRRLTDFIAQIEHETYPEAPSELHSTITENVLHHFFSKYQLPAQAIVLDVGCGQGVAMEMFLQRGFKPIGITLNGEDVAACNRKGLEVYHMDQSFLDFPDDSIDFIWNRHCIEHSIFPYFTLYEMKRVLKPGGMMYIEVPAADTCAEHQTNPNHYSVMGKSMWHELIKRTGFELLEQFDLDFTVMAGPDKYHSFIMKKKG